MPENGPAPNGLLYQKAKNVAERVPFAISTKRFLVNDLPQNIDRLRNRESISILSKLPSFVPNSAGSYASRAELACAAAENIFPVLCDFLETTKGKLNHPVTTRNFCESPQSQDAASKLKERFDFYGSDKSTSHDYHLVYGTILASTTVSRILEVGLGTNDAHIISNMGGAGRPGGSLRAFRDILPEAKIYGADVDKQVLFTEDRIQTFFVDQTDLISVRDLAANLPERFDLIIDDGLHSPHANVAILTLAMRKLRPGGWIVIEDIIPDALPIWQVISTLMPNDFDSQIIEARGALMFVSKRSDSTGHDLTVKFSVGHPSSLPVRLGE